MAKKDRGTAAVGSASPSVTRPFVTTDEGKFITVRETATNGVGAPVVVIASPIGPVMTPAPVCELQIAAPNTHDLNQTLSYSVAMAQGSCDAWQTWFIAGDATGGPNGDGAIIGQIDSVGGVAIEPGPGIGSAASSFPAARQ